MGQGREESQVWTMEQRSVRQASVGAAPIHTRREISQRSGSVSRALATQPAIGCTRCLISPVTLLVFSPAMQAKLSHPSASALWGDGMHYVGSLNADGQPHGQGVTFRSDGSAAFTLQLDPTDATNSGRWVDGLLHGRVRAILASGDRYEGTFKAHKVDGLAVYAGVNGTRFEGEWLAGKPDGLGVMWDRHGKITHCGRSTERKLARQRRVPLALLPEKHYLSEHGQLATATARASLADQLWVA